ncbi:MAG TPA: sortase [Egibacteraceae bacterium]|nr:sortase [Egibacteraceae bacterium]
MLAVSRVLAAGIPVSWALTAPPREAGRAPASVDPTIAPDRSSAADPAGPATPAGESPTVGASLSVPATPGSPPPSVRSGRIDDFQQVEAEGPRRLSIPAIGVDAPVIAVGVDADGAMEVPDDVLDVGWYRHGPGPGEPGSAVLAAHVDSRQQGRGVFFDLRRLDVGDQLVVTDDAGEQHRFVVQARRTYDKATLPAAELFERTGPPRLVLITCGGEFNAEASSYRDNVVIYAVPQSGS